MKKRVIIIPYNRASMSARNLQRELKQVLNVPVYRIHRDSKVYQPRYTDYIINWGCSKDWDFITFDKKEGNKKAVNKLEFFAAISAWNATNENKVNIPEWTTDPNKAAMWITQEKATVVARHTLTGHSGKGVEILTDATHIPKVPLYTKYKKKKHEFRVHIFQGEVIDVVQKKKRAGAENVDTKIRSHLNGWVFCRQGITEPQDLRRQAILAITACNLKFGAVDVIWNEHENKCYVLEVNSAPGIEGTTLLKYTVAFTKEILA